jgi:hypothetical protein
MLGTLVHAIHNSLFWHPKPIKNFDGFVNSQNSDPINLVYISKIA